MFLELEGRVKLGMGLVIWGGRGEGEGRGGGGGWGGRRETNFLEGNKRGTSVHVGCFGAGVDAPFGVCVEGGLFYWGRVVGAHHGGFGTYLDLGWRWWAGEPRGVWGEGHGCFVLEAPVGGWFVDFGLCRPRARMPAS